MFAWLNVMLSLGKVAGIAIDAYRSNQTAETVLSAIAIQQYNDMGHTLAPIVTNSPMVRAHSLKNIPQLDIIFGSLKEKRFSNELRGFRETLIKGLCDGSDALTSLIKGVHMSPKLSRYFTKIEPQGVPYVDFADEPEQVSQLKKIINALSIVEKLLIVIEAYPFYTDEDTVQRFDELWHTISPEVLKVTTLVSRLDIDLTSIFSGELRMIEHVITQFQQVASQNTDYLTNGIAWDKVQQWVPVIARQAGIAIDQLNPNAKHVDIHFITQLGGVLSGYVAQWTSQLHAISGLPGQYTPTIDDATIKGLASTAEELYWDVTRMQTGGALEKINLLNLRRIFNHMTTLQTHILEQGRHGFAVMSDATIHLLSELKYKWIFPLFFLIDKVELYSALKPGTLASYVLKELQEWYQLLTDFSQNMADIKTIRPDLLIIDDALFLHTRWTNLLSHIAGTTTAELELDEVQQHWHDFYAILDLPSPPPNTTLSSLSHDVKQTLLQHYKAIRPFMLSLVAYDARILRDLDAVAPNDVPDKTPVDIATLINDTKQTIEQAINKKHTSLQFYRTLANDLIHTIFSQSNPWVLPYAVYQNIFQHQAPTTTYNATPGPIADHHAYQIATHALNTTKQACIDLCDELDQIIKTNWIADKTKMRHLYLMIQPHLINGQNTALDEQIVELLKTPSQNPSNYTDSLLVLRNLVDKTRTAITHKMTDLDATAIPILASARTAITQQMATATIQFDKEALKRLHHLMPTTHFSKLIQKLSDAVNRSLILFNTPIRAELDKQSPTLLPYPDIEEEIPALQTCDQVYWIKRLKNAIYYLQAFFISMEHLDSRMDPHLYTTQVFIAYFRLYRTIDLINSLRNDPHLNLIVNEIILYVNQIRDIWLDIRPIYAISSTDIQTPAGNAAYSGIWYPMLGFMISPEHINALRQARGFTALDAKAHQILAKKTTLEIESIIAKSDSYFRLLLSSPTMISLYSRLKTKFAQFSGTTYSAVIDHLKSVCEDVIPAILKEADAWELKLGLRPGLIATPIQDTLNQFVLNFIEPLALPSDTHLALTASLHDLTERKRALRARQVFIEKECARLNEFIKQLDPLKQTMEQLTPAKIQQEIALLVATPIAPDTADTPTFRDVFQKQLKNAFPILTEQQSTFTIGFLKPDLDQPLDTLCHALLPDQKPIENIKFLTYRCSAAYEGRKQKQRMEKALIDSQLEALDKSDQHQKDRHEQYKQDYAAQALKQHAKAMAEQQTDVIHLRKEFEGRLQHTLLKDQKKMVQTLLSLPGYAHIQEEALSLLQIPLTQFAQQQYAPLMQLESIASALAHLKDYCVNESTRVRLHQSLFESETTLKQKIHLIETMEALVINRKVPVKERLTQLREKANSPAFKHHLLAYHQFDRLSWKGLKQLVLQLLRVIGLYKPPHERNVEALLKSTCNRPSNLTPMVARYSLFTQGARRYDLPQLPTPQSMKTAVP